MKEVLIYTDGACSGNPGVGGWGAVLIFNGIEKKISGGDKFTTNNRMELQAAISGMNELKEKCSVKLFSDSSYLINSFLLKWVYAWKGKNWIKSGKVVPNKDLWEKLIILNELHSIEWIKVKGHSDNELNNECDRLARMSVIEIKEQEAKKLT